MIQLRTLLFLSLLLVLPGATCIAGKPRQVGPSGPWIGSIVNTGPLVVNTVGLVARYSDADNKPLAEDAFVACPSTLLPLEHADFEAFYQSGSTTPAPPSPKLPLSAKFVEPVNANEGEGVARGEGLYVRVVQTAAVQRLIRLEVRNNGSATYMARDITVCGVLRSPDGVVAEIGRADGPNLPTVLLPGTAISLDMHFNSMPEDFTSQFFAVGLPNTPLHKCCIPGLTGWHAVDAGRFTVQLPDGWVFKKLQGIDSYVGEFSGDGITLGFDFGIYTGAPSPAQGFRITDETIGGHPAKIAGPGTPGSGTAIVHVDELGAGTIGDRTFPVTLSLRGDGLTPDQQQLALLIFRSLRFPK